MCVLFNILLIYLFIFLGALKNMTNKTDLSSQSTQFKRQICKKVLISEKIKYLKEFQDIILHLDAAVNLVTLIQILKNYAQEPDNDIILSNQKYEIKIFVKDLTFVYHFTFYYFLRRYLLEFFNSTMVFN